MTDEECAQLANRFHQWFQDDFLDNEERSGKKWSQSEREGHLLRVGWMFRSSLFCNWLDVRSLPIQDTEGILDRYMRGLHAALVERELSEGRELTEEEREREYKYYSWPVAMFFVGRMQSAEEN